MLSWYLNLRLFKSTALCFLNKEDIAIPIGGHTGVEHRLSSLQVSLTHLKVTLPSRKGLKTKVSPERV